MENTSQKTRRSMDSASPELPQGHHKNVKGVEKKAGTNLENKTKRFDRIGIPMEVKKFASKSRILTENPTHVISNRDLPLIDLTKRSKSSDPATKAPTSRSEKENRLVSMPSKRKLGVSKLSEPSQPPRKRPRLGTKTKHEPKRLKTENKSNGNYKIVNLRPQTVSKGLKDKKHGQTNNSSKEFKKQSGQRNISKPLKKTKTKKTSFCKVKPKKEGNNTRKKVNKGKLAGRLSKKETNQEIVTKVVVPQSLDERCFYAQMTNLPMDKDYPDETKSLDWVIEAHKRMIDDFIDVNPGEKKFMFLWNLFVTRNPCYSKIQMPFSLKEFVKLHGEEIKSQNVYRNFLLHLTQLANWGIITPHCMAEIVIATQEKFHQLRAIEKANDDHEEKVKPLVVCKVEPEPVDDYTKEDEKKTIIENNNVPPTLCDKLCKEEDDDDKNIVEDQISRMSLSDSGKLLTNG